MMKVTLHVVIHLLTDCIGQDARDMNEKMHLMVPMASYKMNLIKGY